MKKRATGVFLDHEWIINESLFLLYFRFGREGGGGGAKKR
jgi:hypothetical protein